MNDNSEFKVRASVAMAVYNAHEYICEQIDSILCLMNDDDELVISYDKSSDSTWDIITDYSARDCRVKVFENTNAPGVRGNFTNAVEHCLGKYIFLSDQDDIWFNDKINKIVDIFEKTSFDLVVHDANEGDGSLNVTCSSVFDKYNISKSGFRNYVSSTASGCCMAFRAQMKEILLPFPKNNPHDVWTMMICAAFGRIFLLYEVLMTHRIHGKNVTVQRRSIPVIIVDRFTLGFHFLVRYFKYSLKKRRNK